jgi:hypothetical protein
MPCWQAIKAGLSPQRATVRSKQLPIVSPSSETVLVPCA